MYKHLVYLAGPISGYSFKGATDWREYVKTLLHPTIAGVSPMRAKAYLRQQHLIKDTYEEIALSSGKGITARDLFDCRRCDMILVNFLEAKHVSIGTVMEIAWGRAFDKPVVVAMSEENIHWHAMIRESVGFIVPTLEEAAHIVNAVLLPEPEVRQEYCD